jgi:hypothetical protein
VNELVKVGLRCSVCVNVAKGGWFVNASEPDSELVACCVYVAFTFTFTFTFRVSTGKKPAIGYDLGDDDSPRQLTAVHVSSMK